MNNDVKIDIPRNVTDTTIIRIDNICCQMEAVLVHELLDPIEDIKEVRVSVLDRIAFVKHTSNIKSQDIVSLINTKYLGASLKETGGTGDEETIWNSNTIKKMYIYVVQIILFILGCISQFLIWPCNDKCHSSFTYIDKDHGGTGKIVAVVLWVVCILLSYDLFYQSYLSICRRRANVEFLMAIAVIGSIILGEVFMAAMIIIIIVFMDFIKDVAFFYVDKKIKGMIVETPSTISIVGEKGTIPKEILAKDLKEGMIFVVRVGEAIPSDGNIIFGEAMVDESSMTGEALPLIKSKGLNVIAGSIVQSGFIHVKATTDVNMSFQGKITQAVRNAKDVMTPTAALVSKFANWYTPFVVIVSIIVGIIMMDARKFLVILVAGCPCGLLGATPLINGTVISVLASKYKFLIKDANVLDSLANMEKIGVDKTGTITEGNFELINLITFGNFDEETIHKWAATVESADNHPLAVSITQSYTGCIVAFAGKDGLPELTHFQREGRNGVRGVVEGNRIGVGNYEFIKKETNTILKGNILKVYEECNNKGITIFISVNREIAGILLLDDVVRGDAKPTIKELKKLGIIPTMLTGDKDIIANRVAELVEINEVKSSLLPEQKAEWVSNNILKENDDEAIVGFIGDGLNDCVALATAKVGIVIQEVGSATTVDAADAILQGDLGNIPAAIIIAKRANKLVWINIAIAIILNVGVMVVAALPNNTYQMPLWFAVLFDNIGLLVVLVNSLWPLCWDVPIVSGNSQNIFTETGGKLKYSDRKKLLEQSNLEIGKSFTSFVSQDNLSPNSTDSDELHSCVVCWKPTYGTANILICSKCTNHYVHRECVSENKCPGCDDDLDPKEFSLIDLDIKRPFKCKICKLSFVREGGLKIHMIQHQ